MWNGLMHSRVELHNLTGEFIGFQIAMQLNLLARDLNPRRCRSRIGCFQFNSSLQTLIASVLRQMCWLEIRELLFDSTNIASAPRNRMPRTVVEPSRKPNPTQARRLRK
jgi:hypothetical protein